MATTTIRWLAVQRVVALIQAALPGVQVTTGFPGDLQEDESIWVGYIEGTVDIPTIKAGRKDRDDIFKLPVEIRVANSIGLDETGDRLEELVAAVENVDADDVQLGGLDGLVDAVITEKRGPLLWRTAEGAVGFAQVVFECHARYN